MQPHLIRIVFAVAAALSLALSAAGCARKQEPTPTVRRVEYTVRAEIKRLPGADEPAPELQARHEAIPSFVEKLGDPPTGMRAMTMPFPIGPGLDLSGLQVGDKVDLTFEVDYSLDTGLVTEWRATAIKPLAPETELQFGAAGATPE